jgi:hypothetical protein
MVAEHPAFRRSDADDAGAGPAGREHIACHVGLLAVTDADDFSKDGKCAFGPLNLRPSIPPDKTVCVPSFSRRITCLSLSAHQITRPW